jgi:hypothetical protein
VGSLSKSNPKLEVLKELVHSFFRKSALLISNLLWNKNFIVNNIIQVFSFWRKPEGLLLAKANKVLVNNKSF